MNNNYLRNFYLSSSTFSFYRVELDIRYINSIEDIIEKVRNDLLNTLEKYNFVSLNFQVILQMHLSFQYLNILLW